MGTVRSKDWQDNWFKNLNQTTTCLQHVLKEMWGLQSSDSEEKDSESIEKEKKKEREKKRGRGGEGRDD